MKKFLASLLALLLIDLSTEAQQWGDYTLYSVQNSSNAYLLDTVGNVYHTWTFASNKKTGYSCYLLPGGDIIRTVSNNGNSLNGGGMTGAVQKSDYAGNVLWDYVYSSSTYCLHHDICPLPNGNVLVVSYDVRTAADMTAAGSAISHNMWMEKIMEIQPTGTSGGNVVWEWHLYDHLCQDDNANNGNYVTSVYEHPELWDINYQNTSQTTDWMHLNGIDYNPELDQIVFSSHMLNELYVIDHSTTTAEAAGHTGGNSGKGGDLLYRWGNPAAYGGSGTATFNVIHDAHFIPAGSPNAGYVVGFNNNGVSQNQSCVDIIAAPHLGYLYDVTPGTNMLPSTYTQRQNCTGHTGNMGSSEQLPNGNMLICVAQSGLIYEIDAAGTTLWSKTISGIVPQAHRYTACYVAGTTPSAPTASGNSSLLSSTSGTGYQWYLNGSPISGANSQTYTPTTSGSYQVAIVELGNCQSELSNSIDVIVDGIVEENNSTPYWYPNPTNGIVHLSAGNVNVPNLTVQVLDITGKLVAQFYQTNQLNLSALSNGIYVLKINDGSTHSVQRITLNH